MRRYGVIFLATLSLSIIPAKGAVASEAVGGEGGEKETRRLAVAVYALYYAPGIPKDAVEHLRGLCEKEQIALLEESKSEEPPRKATILFGWYPPSDFAPIRKENLPYFAVGVEPEDVDRMHLAPKVLVLISAIPLSDRHRPLHRKVEKILYGAASHGGAFIWDEAQRLCYSREAWKDRVMESWRGDLPDMRSQINMHAYRESNLIRVVTLGMEKFFLPDLVIEHLPQGHVSQGRNLLNVIAQHFVEGSFFDDDGKMRINLKDLKHKVFRGQLVDSSFENAALEIDVHLKMAATKEGDNDNVLMEIDFGHMEGTTVQEKQSVFFDRLFGSEDTITMVESGNERLLEASRKAKARLLELKPRFTDGFETNERVMVKLPFTHEEDVEYMWIELVSWKDGQMYGILMNDPGLIPDLKSGAPVQVSEDKIYDFIWNKPDGSEEGNETGRIIMELQK